MARHRRPASRTNHRRTQRRADWTQLAVWATVVLTLALLLVAVLAWRFPVPQTVIIQPAPSAPSRTPPACSHPGVLPSAR